MHHAVGVELAPCDIARTVHGAPTKPALRDRPADAIDRAIGVVDGDDGLVWKRPSRVGTPRFIERTRVDRRADQNGRDLADVRAGAVDQPVESESVRRVRARCDRILVPAVGTEAYRRSGRGCTALGALEVIHRSLPTIHRAKNRRWWGFARAGEGAHRVRVSKAQRAGTDVRWWPSPSPRLRGSRVPDRHAQHIVTRFSVDP